MGWAVLLSHDSGIDYVDSGILGLNKGDIKDQEYKLLLIKTLIDPMIDLMEKHDPDHVVNEIVPSVGSGNFAVAGQGYLANTAIVVANVVAAISMIPFSQIAARTVQTKVARRPDKPTKKISKVQVRNGVIDRLPELKDRAKDMVADETDAIAIGLAWLDIHHAGSFNGRKTGKEA